MKKDNQEHSEEDKPPILRSWRNIYIAVFTNLIILIILFYLFKEHYS
ncbi:MAG TPA: hypothetical protein PKM97_03345 [Bacteroidia bacterium]|nr:hypothetical protein [Bacteroidia bacterium]